MSETGFPIGRSGGPVELPLDRDFPRGASPLETTAPRLGQNSIRLTEWAKSISSFPTMLGALLVGLVFCVGRLFFVDPDAWWHIKVGQDILATHQWPTTDTYSFTVHGSPWIAYEWLAEVMLGIVARLGGIVALDALIIVLASMVMLALYYYGTLRSGNCKAGFVGAVILSFLALLSFTLRPQMFGYLFLVLLLITMEWFRKGVSWPIWSLPVLFLVWVNAHGSFIIGIGVLLVYLCSGLRTFKLGSVEAVAWSAAQRVKLLTVLLLSLAVLPITPYGTQLAVYPFDIAFNQPINVANILEWKPMPFDLYFGKLFLGVMALVLVLQLLFRFTWRLEELILALGGAVMACLHVRFVLLFVPFFVPILATVLARWVPPYRREKDRYYGANAVLIAGVIAAIVCYAPSRQFLQKKVDQSFPVEALRYLDTHDVPGPMLNNYGFGGYLISTGRKVFIDGRADIYERTGVLSDFDYLGQMKPGAFSVLDRYHIASCLLIYDEPLATVLLSSPNWKRVYVDGTSALFVRTAIKAELPESHE